MSPGAPRYSPPNAPAALGTRCLQPGALQSEGVFGHPFELVRGKKVPTVIGKLPEVRALAGNVQTPAWKEEGPVGLRRSEDGGGGLGKVGC